MKNNTCRVPEGETPVTWEDLKTLLMLVILGGSILFFCWCVSVWIHDSIYQAGKGQGLVEGSSLLIKEIDHSCSKEKGCKIEWDGLVWQIKP